jgi:hypothetical protein
MNTTTERTDRDRRIWQIRDILSRVKPDDMTDAELEAAHAVFRLAASRLPGGKPIMIITPAKALDGTGLSDPESTIAP